MRRRSGRGDRALLILFITCVIVVSPATLFQGRRPVTVVRAALAAATDILDASLATTSGSRTLACIVMVVAVTATAVLVAAATDQWRRTIGINIAAVTAIASSSAAAVASACGTRDQIRHVEQILLFHRVTVIIAESAPLLRPGIIIIVTATGVYTWPCHQRRGHIRIVTAAGVAAWPRHQRRTLIIFAAATRSSAMTIHQAWHVGFFAVGRHDVRCFSPF
jgi:hypothetical protein